MDDLKIPTPDWMSPCRRVALYNGNALELLPKMPRGYFGAVITDPPYSSGGTFRGDRCGRSTTEKYQLTGTEKEYDDFAGDTRDQRSYGFWCSLWIEKCMEVVIPGGICGLFTDWRQLPTTTDALQSGGFVWRGIVPWDKTESARPMSGRYRSQCEYLVWGSRGGMLDDGPCLPGYIRQSVNGDEKKHLTGKPITVMETLIDIAWRPEAKILDPFMGSASTGVAAIRRGKRFVGFEISDPIFRGAVERVEEELARAPLFKVEAGESQRALFEDAAP